MSKILLIAEKIKDELAFIRKIRELTNQPLSEIRKNLTNKKPFFEALVSGNNGPENEKLVQQILRFAKKQGDKIKVLEQNDNEPYEITRESFENSVKMGKEILKEFEKMDDETDRNLE